MQLAGFITLYIFSSFSLILAKSFLEMFHGAHSKLSGSMDVSHGFLEHLLDQDVINGRHVEDIKAYRTESERVDRLLTILERRDDSLVAAFLQALIDTGQQSIVDKCLQSPVVPVRVAVIGDDPDMCSVDDFFSKLLNEAHDLIYSELVPDPEIQWAIAQLRHKDMPQFKRDPLYGELYSQVKGTFAKLRFPPESLKTVSELSTNLLAIPMKNDSPTRTTRSILVLLRYDDIDSVRRIGEQRQSGLLDHMLAEDVIELFDCKTSLAVSIHWYICDKTLPLPVSDPSPETGEGQTSMDASIYSTVIIAVLTILCITYIIPRNKGLIVGNKVDVESVKAASGIHIVGQKLPLPVEMLELLLRRSYVSLLKSDIHVPDGEQVSYQTLASVCSEWWQTLNGWPQSNTKHWVRHRLQQDVKRMSRKSPRLVNKFDVKSGVCGVAHMDNKVFVADPESDEIRVFGPNDEQLKVIIVNGMKLPRDIVACSETRSLYVADLGKGSHGCVWRVATDGQVSKFLSTTTTTFSPISLSVTSGQLLVTTSDDVLLLYGADGVQLNRLSFSNMSGLQHAVKTSHDTFVFSHLRPQPRVVKVDRNGRIISIYNDEQLLSIPRYLSLDSEGNLFIADADKEHILLLTSDFMSGKVLISNEQEHSNVAPFRLLYVQRTHELITACLQSSFVRVIKVG